MTTTRHLASVRVQVLLAALAWTSAAGAADYEIHGFASQGFAYSDGNNVYGESTDGSFKLYEFGLNGTLSAGSKLLFSAQGLLRDAGETDNEGLRLDYALADYQFLVTPAVNAGVRAGRVKNPFGLFNEARDAVFTRPGIALPQSVYFDGQGFRRLLFAADGAQLYGGLSHGDHYTSLTIGTGRTITATEDEKRQLSLSDFDGDLEFSNFGVARLQDEIGGGQWRFALSYLQVRLSLSPNPGETDQGEADFRLYALSAQHNADRYSLTAEYLLTASKGVFSQFGAIDSKSDGAYLQADYRISPYWSVTGRYDVTFANRNDRDGREFAALPAPFGGDRHRQFTKDFTAGLNWKPDSHWGFWAEYHFLDGTSSVSSADNAGRPLQNHWGLFLLMAAFRF